MSRLQIIFRIILIFIFLFSGILLGPVETQAQFDPSSKSTEIRAIWITRWDYKSPEDIQYIMENAARFNFNMVLFQVRGNGTVFYPSTIEPWADELGGKNPGWDPLRIAISIAHRNKLELHAWINLYIGGLTSKVSAKKGEVSYLMAANQHISFSEKSKTANLFLETADSTNELIPLWQSHPEWFCRDVDNKPQPWGGTSNYLWLDPASQEVQDYLYRLVMELVQNYDLDGIHFDYFRYPGPFVSDKANRRESGDVYRRDQINNWLRRIYVTAKSQKPDLIISAAVIGDYYLGSRVYLQDSHRWLAEGIIDIIFPMTYTPSNQLLRHWLRTHKQVFHNRYVCPGLMVYQNRILASRNLAVQIAEVRKNDFAGYAIFSYQSLFPSHLPNEQAQLFRETLQTQPVPVPKISHSEKFLNPVFSEVKIFSTCSNDTPHSPSDEMHFHLPQVRTPFRIGCALKASSANNLSLADYQAFLLWDTDRYFSHPRRVRMQTIFKDEDTQAFVTTKPILPELDFGAQIMAFRSIAYTENNGHTQIVASNVQFVPVLPASSLFFHQLQNPWGPLIPGANSMAMDEEKPAKLWLTSPCRGEIVVLDSSGTQAFFSPLRIVRNATGKSIAIRNPLSIACGVNHTMVVAHYSTTPQLVWLDSRNGSFRYSIELNFYPGDVSVDGRGFVYVTEADNDAWHVFNPEGKELEGSPFYGGYVNQGIAVSRDGHHVFVSCRAGANKEDGQSGVYHWIGECYGNRADFYQVTNVPAFDTSIGGLTVDREGNLYICEPVLGAVRVVTSAHSLLGFIIGGNPTLRAPRDVAVHPNGRLVYVLDTGGATPVRVQRWERE